MSVSASDLKLLTDVVGRFENSGDPYQGVSGDFDGMGISCGVLQWNIGSNSLQPLVQSIGKANVLAAMPSKGAKMWEACNTTVPKGLQIVRSWQTNNQVTGVARTELRALMGSPPMRAAQDAKIKVIAERADDWAKECAMSRGAAARTLQELAWFFDIATQNGNMKDIGFNDVKAFKTTNGADKSDDVVCDWLAGLGSGFAGFKDCHKNGALWRNAVSGVGLDLLVLSYLRAQKSTLRWRGDVANRKGTLAVRKGHVHGTLYNFTDLL